MWCSRRAWIATGHVATFKGFGSQQDMWQPLGLGSQQNMWQPLECSDHNRTCGNPLRAWITAEYVETL